MFDPTIGRWLEMDPIAFDAGDANLYRAMGNDPTNATDPSGNDDIPHMSTDLKNDERTLRIVRKGERSLGPNDVELDGFVIVNKNATFNGSKGVELSYQGDNASHVRIFQFAKTMIFFQKPHIQPGMENCAGPISKYSYHFTGALEEPITKLKHPLSTTGNVVWTLDHDPAGFAYLTSAGGNTGRTSGFKVWAFDCPSLAAALKERWYEVIRSGGTEIVGEQSFITYFEVDGTVFAQATWSKISTLAAGYYFGNLWRTFSENYEIDQPTETLNAAAGNHLQLVQAADAKIRKLKK